MPDKKYNIKLGKIIHAVLWFYSNNFKQKNIEHMFTFTKWRDIISLQNYYKRRTEREN